MFHENIHVKCRFAGVEGAVLKSKLPTSNMMRDIVVHFLGSVRRTRMSFAKRSYR